MSLAEFEIRATERAAAALRDPGAHVPEAWETLARLLPRHEGIASSGIEGLREPMVSVLIAERTGAAGAGWIAATSRSTSPTLPTTGPDNRHPKAA